MAAGSVSSTTASTSKIRRFIQEGRRRGLLHVLRIAIRWLVVQQRAKDPELIRKAQHYNDAFFSDLGVTRGAANELYEAAAVKVGFAIGSLDSFHRLAFAALAASGFAPKTVLELGTSHGETTAYLAELFPGADIHTVELPLDDPLYERMHPEFDKRDERAGILSRYPRIHPMRVNTVWLQDQNLPDFDLIWLDAGHHFPEVAWDHFFCMHKLRPGGWLLTDDIMLPDNKLARKRPRILDVWNVVEYFDKRQDVQFRLLLKREDPRQYVINPKFVGAFQRPPRKKCGGSGKKAAPARAE